MRLLHQPSDGLTHALVSQCTDVVQSRRADISSSSSSAKAYAECAELPGLAAEQPWTGPVCVAHLNSSSLRRLFFFLSDSHCGRLFPAETS